MMVLNHANVRNARTTNNAVTDETLLPAAYDVAIEGISDSGRGQRELYYLGIIDILQKYNVRKHLETDLNILTRGLKHYKECSCVSPNEYRDRFLKFLRRIF
jgi:1-phosphatidylinositol-4-phosphate 5-kinase|tara:strand:+ start:1890 stop:2195 length:306 start_codon:yes stop_codon:yes gene_type:complete